MGTTTPTRTTRTTPDVPDLAAALGPPHAHRHTERRRAAATRRAPRGWRIAVVVLVGLVVAGLLTTRTRIEGDLERRALDALRDAGAVGVDVRFSGQDGEVSCGVPANDPLALAAAVEAVHGVRNVRLAESCGGSRRTPSNGSSANNSDGSAAASPTVAAPAPDAAVAAEAQAPAVTVSGTPLPPVVSLGIVAELADGRLVLRGTVPGEADRTALVAAAAAHLEPVNVVDELVVLPDAAVGADDVAAALAATARLVDVVAAHLVSGTVILERGRLSVEGVYADAASLRAVRAEADASGAGLAIAPRPQASASDAATVAELLNRIVADDPIVFRVDGIELTDEAEAVLDRVAAVADRYEGVAIEVIGHTDTRGDAASNQALSEWRAMAVVGALLDRGVTAALEATGRGERDPIVVDGVEDPAASRRVEFVVEAV